MHSYQRAMAVALATFGASVLGMALQLIVPAQVLTDSKGTVGAMVGLITLLLALVLGLLVYTAFTVYTTQQAEAQGLGPVVIELDVILEEYGPEAMRGRVGLREALGRSRRRFFGDAEAWAAGPYVRGDPGDDALDEHLFRQPSALDG